MFNLALINEAVSAAIPERTAIIHRDRRLTYAQVASRSRRLANFLLSHGITIQQEREGLEKDGVAGPKTLIRLHSAVAMPEIPRLAPAP